MPWYIGKVRFESKDSIATEYSFEDSYKYFRQDMLLKCLEYRELIPGTFGH